MSDALDVLAAGFPSLDRIFGLLHLPRPGETATITFLDDAVHAGGCGVNVGVGLARLGRSAGVACVIGSDAEGRSFLRTLAEQGIDVRGVTAVPGARTSRSYLFNDPSGTVMNFFYPGAAGELQAPPDLSLLPPCRYGLVTVGPAAYNRAFIRTMRARGVPVVVQMRLDADAYVPVLDEALAGAWAVLMNRHEADFLMRRAGVTAVPQLFGPGTGVLVVTLGAEGAEAWTREGHWRILAAPARQVVDTTGAGDAFTAGWLTGVLRGLPMPVALSLGSVVASFAVEQVGAQEGLPDLARVAERLAAMGQADLARQLGGMN